MLYRVHLTMNGVLTLDTDFTGSFVIFKFDFEIVTAFQARWIVHLICQIIKYHMVIKCLRQQSNY